MGDNSFAPILGSGSAVINMNGKCILIRDCLHVTALCGFIGMQGLGICVFFPSFIVKVNTATDCHLTYAPVGQSSTMSLQDYVQPIQTSHPVSATSSFPQPHPTVIEEDKDNIDDDTDYDVPPELLPTYAPHWPKRPPTPPSLPINLDLIPPPEYSVSLKDLDRNELIRRLFMAKHLLNTQQHGANSKKSPAPARLECMKEDKIIAQLYHPNTRLQPVRPCAMPSNSSETKTVFTPKELHRITGCRRFRTTSTSFQEPKMAPLSTPENAPCP